MIGSFIENKWGAIPAIDPTNNSAHPAAAWRSKSTYDAARTLMKTQSLTHLALLATCVLCRAQSFTNGGFETPMIPPGTGKPLDQLSSPFVGWTLSGSGGTPELVNGQIPAVGLDFDAAEGNQHLSFNGGDSPAGRSISQTFDTRVGGEYALTFNVGRIGISNGAVSITATILSDSGQVLGSRIAIPPAHGYGAEQRVLFTAASATTTVRLLDTSAETVAVDVLLDAVNLETIHQYTFQFTTEKLWDFSGSYSDADVEQQVQLNVIHTPLGKIAGTRSEAVTNDTLHTAGGGSINGKVRSTAQGLRVQYSVFLTGQGTFEGEAATIEGRLRFGYFLNQRMLVGTVSGAGCLTHSSGRRCQKINGSDRWDLRAEMTGAWELLLDVEESGAKVAGTGAVRMSNGREVLFTVTGTRRKTGVARLTLRGAGDAIGVVLRVTADESMSLKTVRGRLFGQVVRVQR
jgi:hypothetical protein